MAKKVMLIDDVSGETIDEGLGGGTIRFSVEDKHYTIDLGTKNTEAFHKSLENWIEHAAEDRTSGSTRTRRTTSSSDGRASTGSGRSKEELQAVRDWCAKEGIEVAPRGRIAATILEKFDQAHKS